MNIFARAIAVLGAAALGVLLSVILLRSAAFRDGVGQLFKRGHLLAVVGEFPHESGIYEADVDEADGDDLRSVIIAENLRARSAHQRTNLAAIQKEFDFLRAQFATEKLFRAVMQSSGLSDTTLKQKIAEQLRGRSWLARRLEGVGDVSEMECSDFYAAHQSEFAQPVRFRAAHLFLAAPEGTSPEIVETKRKAIIALSERIKRGEDFAPLVAEASEDEATKKLGGDLGIFSAWRMPPDFFGEVEKLHAGETSRPFQSQLGFHIVRLLERKEGGELPFEAVRSEIAMELRNQRRKNAIAVAAEQLSVARYMNSH